MRHDELAQAGRAWRAGSSSRWGSVWDFGLLGTRASGRELRPAQAVAVAAVYLTGIVSVWFVATS